MTMSRFKKLFLALFIAPLVATSSAYSVDPCECSWFEGVEVGADFILWKPCFDDLDYAVSYDSDVIANPTGSGKYQYVSHDFEPGFSVSLRKNSCICDWNLIGSYTRLTGSSKDTSSPSVGGILRSTLLPGSYLANETSISSRHEFEYQTYDLLFGHDFTLACCHQFSPYTGVTGMCLSQKIKSEMSPGTVNAAEVKWNSNYWGVGFKVGTGYNWTICNGFSFYANGAASILTGQLSSTDHAIKSANSLNLKLKSHQCVFVPGCEIGMGFNYVLCICERMISLNAGYEFLEWYNVGSQRRISDTTIAYGHTNSASKQTVGYHGLRLGARVNF